MKRFAVVIAVAGAGLAATTLRAAAPPCRYTVSADNLTVTDNSTGLTWQRAVSTQTYDSSDAAAACTSLSLGGLTSGWRLPTIKELQTLVDRRAATGPVIDVTSFPNTLTTANYWSSTVDKAGASAKEHWSVSFASGVSTGTDDTLPILIRCVR
jgi:hypothetical protein